MRHAVLPLQALARVVLASALVVMCVSACKREAPTQAEAAGPVPATPGETSPVPAEPESGPADAEFPALKIATLDGTQYDLAAHRGKWVVVNFWATWCKPCVKEMPELSALDAMRDHVEVLGLAYDDSEPQDIRAFLDKRPVVYPIAIVDTFDPPQAFATPRGLPTTYLIGPDGRMVRKFMGPITAAEIEAAIAEAGGPKTG